MQHSTITNFIDLLHLFGLLLFLLSGFIFKFKDAVWQVFVPAFQRFHFSTPDNTAWRQCAMLSDSVLCVVIRISSSPLRDCRDRQPESGGWTAHSLPDEACSHCVLLLHRMLGFLYFCMFVIF